MEHYQVILAYDGSEFQGFQRQANKHTVQGAFEAALTSLGWQGRALLAAGRTDRGVHATGQVLAFDLDWQHSPDKLLQALNAHLPAAMAVHSLRQVPADFHPRYLADWRSYQYLVVNQPLRSPLLERYAWRVWPAADLALMQLSASRLVGRYDFAAFGSPLKRLSHRSPHARSSTVRTVFHAGWKEQAPYLVFEITANAFLYHMVRRLVHVQVMIGQGRLPVEALTAALASPETEASVIAVPAVHGLAPAHGLTLVEVHYPPQALNGTG